MSMLQRLFPPLQGGVFLFLGEASFGFTSALNRLGVFANQKRVVCTCFETEQHARELFGGQLTANVNSLRQSPNVEARVCVRVCVCRVWSGAHSAE